MPGMFPADLEQLAAFRTWCEQTDPPMDRDFYLYNAVSLSHLVVLADHIFPRIIQHRGGYFIEDHFSVASFEAFEQKGFPMSAIEGSLNWFTVEDLIRSEVGGDEVERMGSSMAHMFAFGWKTAAMAQFPGVPFVSSVGGDLDMIVTLHVERKGR